jgi:prephenate dehydrogenase
MRMGSTPGAGESMPRSPCDTRLVRIALLGFGLIGGSIARALRRDAGEWTIAAWSPSGDGPERAQSEGIVDEAASSPAAAIRGADLVVLAGPPLACLELIDDLGGPLAEALGPDAVVTDAASTKEVIVRRADGAGLRFVGGHPMAGRELTGYEAAEPDLFEGRPWVIVRGADAQPGDRERVEAMALACGAVPVEMTAVDHDAAVAAISHLPLVLSAALVEAVTGASDGQQRPDWATAARLAAGGWQGMTRLARGDEAMGSGIIATNAPAIASRLRDLRTTLDSWLEELDRDGGPDATAVAARLAVARRRLEERE